MNNNLYQDIIENYIEAYNNFDIERMLADMHDNVRFENISGEEVNLITNGIAELKIQAEKARQYFKEREQKITDIRFRSHRVEIEIDYKGILAIDIPGGPKAGDKIELKGRSVFTFRGFKIIELQDITYN
jgi:ketosteroid isomerase-like protein